jgi:hypothetical protein
MLKHLCAALCLCCLAAPVWSQTEAEPASTEAVPEKILVLGQRPGPGLWKVSKGEHVLWVFGSYGPLPKNMQWRSQQVETILAQSQEYLHPPSANASVGFFRSLTMLPHVIGLRKNPDGASLKDVLPAEVHARWLLLKAKYIGENEGIERERPIFAAETLFRAGRQHAGLSNGYEVTAAIDAIVKKNKIKTTASSIQLQLNDPAKLLKDFKKSALDDAACFTKTLERLETDIDAMRVRANAWAKGDLAQIRALNYADQEDSCIAAVTNAAFAREQTDLRSMEARMLEAWLASAEKALATNTSTFATLPMRLLLSPKNYMAALAAKGYQVEAPD